MQLHPISTYNVITHPRSHFNGGLIMGGQNIDVITHVFLKFMFK